MAVSDGSQRHLCDSRRALRRCVQDPSPGAERSERAHVRVISPGPAVVTRAMEVAYIHKLRSSDPAIGYDRWPEHQARPEGGTSLRRGRTRSGAG
jgi:hypothetical protein